LFSNKHKEKIKGGSMPFKSKKKNHIFSCLSTMILFFGFLAGGEDNPAEEKAIREIEWTLKSMSVYEDRFHIDVLFHKEWVKLKEGLIRLKSRIGNEISGDNINTANLQFESLRQGIDNLMKKKDEINFRIFTGLRFQLTGFQTAGSFLIPVILDTWHSIFSMVEADNGPGNGQIDCPEDESRYQEAVVAETNSNRYQPGSPGYSRYLAEAIRLYDAISKSECLPENSSIKSYSRFFITQKKEELELLVKKLKNGNPDPTEKQRLQNSLSSGELDTLGKLYPGWLASLGVDPGLLERDREPIKTVPPAELSGSGGISDKRETATVPQEIKPVTREQIPEIPRISTHAPESVPAITLDVWQSAWGSFDNLDVLLSYLRKNRINKINLNPGLPMGPKFYQEGYEKLKPLVNKFYEAGVKEIGFLYAELNYPVEYFAKFLHLYPDLRINILVDDSEFVDIFSNRFEKNVRDVKKYGIYYSAFVTLETEGNSGVSDQTRFWVLDHVDYPILMSYFGCTLEGQKNKLEKYLSHADQRGIRRRVGIAILMGSKKVGREVSCERLLDEHQMKVFLRELHGWALRNHPSYGGIILETNLKMPRIDVHWDAGR
jgi:hypothetical protein